MSRPRTVNKHLPKYVSVNHGAYWHKPPGKKAVRIAAVGCADYSSQLGAL